MTTWIDSMRAPIAHLRRPFRPGRPRTFGASLRCANPPTCSLRRHHNRSSQISQFVYPRVLRARHQQHRARLPASAMCVGNVRKEPGKKDDDSPQGSPYPPAYSHIFRAFETQLALQRALLLQRLVHDPFYCVMNINSAARLWMLRHLLFFVDYAENRYRMNLLQFFELLGREGMLKYLRFKNAPTEMIELWERMYPPSQTEENNQNTVPVNKQV